MWGAHPHMKVAVSGTNISSSFLFLVSSEDFPRWWATSRHHYSRKIEYWIPNWSLNALPYWSLALKGGLGLPFRLYFKCIMVKTYFFEPVLWEHNRPSQFCISGENLPNHKWINVFVLNFMYTRCFLTSPKPLTTLSLSRLHFYQLTHLLKSLMSVHYLVNMLLS